MNNKQKKMVRLIALILVVVLAGSVVISALLSAAYAEENASQAQNQYAFTIEFLEDEQALRISQRLAYTNASDVHLDRVLFYAPANLFRRESALMYEYEDYEDVFPAGYVPGGIDLFSVQVNQQDADWGFQGTDESYLRVACDLAPGESCEFNFDYYLLITENCGFMGIWETDCRLSDFYFAAAAYDEVAQDFILNQPLAFTRYQHTDAADFTAAVALPSNYLLAGSGNISLESESEGMSLWSVTCEGAHDFALNFGRRYREATRTTASGIELRCLSNQRGVSGDVLDAAEEALACLESWFGPFPISQIHFVESDYALDFKNNTGCIWLSGDTLKSGDALRHAIYFSLAQQYFGMSAYIFPASDAWLSDAVSEYIYYLILEETDGHDAYLDKLNEEVVPSLQITIPGGLYITSDATLMSAAEHEIIIVDRGATVFHELRNAMGRENFISGLRLFYEMGQEIPLLGEYDLVEAFDSASGKSWEAFLTDWLFNISDYANQSYIWLE